MSPATCRGHSVSKRTILNNLWQMNTFQLAVFLWIRPALPRLSWICPCLLSRCTPLFTKPLFHCQIITERIQGVQGPEIKWDQPARSVSGLTRCVDLPYLDMHCIVFVSRNTEFLEHLTIAAWNPVFFSESYVTQGH